MPETQNVEPMTLGALIDELRLRDAAEEIVYDFGGFHVGKIASYRGYYDQLAIGFCEHPSRYVGSLLAECEAAVGATFEGWKGGEYQMDRSTPVWASNAGRSSDTAIVGVIDGGWRTILATAFVE